MSRPGADELRVAARRVLLDALDALTEHRDSLVLIGAQAIYLQTGDAPTALAEATKDSDLAVDPRSLSDDPKLEAAMTAAGFHRDLTHPQPGSWISPDGVPVDLMVPETLAGVGSGRGARIPPHDKHATRRTTGLEAALVSNQRMRISALDSDDARSVWIAVASPAALLISKLYKLAERQQTPRRLNDKDAHDIYRLLVATDTRDTGAELIRLRDDEIAGPSMLEAIDQLGTLFARGPDAPGSIMAGRAEQLVGDPAAVASSASTLASDLITFVETGP